MCAHDRRTRVPFNSAGHRPQLHMLLPCYERTHFEPYDIYLNNYLKTNAQRAGWGWVGEGGGRSTCDVSDGIQQESWPGAGGVCVDMYHYSNFKRNAPPFRNAASSGLPGLAWPVLLPAYPASLTVAALATRTNLIKLELCAYAHVFTPHPRAHAFNSFVNLHYTTPRIRSIARQNVCQMCIWDNAALPSSALSLNILSCPVNTPLHPHAMCFG